MTASLNQTRLCFAAQNILFLQTTSADILPTSIPSRFQWTKASNHEIERAKRWERREAKSIITYSVLCSKHKGGPLETSNVKILILSALSPCIVYVILSL